MINGWWEYSGLHDTIIANIYQLITYDVLVSSVFHDALLTTHDNEQTWKKVWEKNLSPQQFNEYVTWKWFIT